MERDFLEHKNEFHMFDRDPCSLYPPTQLICQKPKRGLIQFWKNYAFKLYHQSTLQLNENPFTVNYIINSSGNFLLIYVIYMFLGVLYDMYNTFFVFSYIFYKSNLFNFSLKLVVYEKKKVTMFRFLRPASDKGKKKNKTNKPRLHKINQVILKETSSGNFRVVWNTTML